MKFDLKFPKRAVKTASVSPPMADGTGADGAEIDGAEAKTSIFSDRKRMLRVVALLSVAAAAGQLVNSVNQPTAKPRVSPAEVALDTAVPTDIQQVAADDEAAASAALVIQEEPAAVLAAATAPALPEMEVAEVEVAEVEVVETAPAAPLLLASAEPAQPPAEAAPVLAAATPETALPLPEAQPELPAQTAGTDTCPVTLDIAVQPGAVLGLTLLAPCQPNARVVLRHEGLVVTGLTTATGALFTTLPAMAATARVEADFGNNTAVATMADVPEALAFRRFGVQWQSDDTFQLNAYENGAEWGKAGHLTALAPGEISDKGGFLQVFGDPSAPMPLLAEVYTFPAQDAAVEVEIEAAVTEKTCGRELIGETITVAQGDVVLTDLTLAMPDCDAIGDFLVLKNLVPDMTLATN